MKKHTKIYLDYYKKMPHEIMCENCGRPAVDIHHIEAKGMGGSKKKDNIENLIALCRECHDCAHAYQIPVYFLKQKHNENLSNRLRK